MKVVSFSLEAGNKYYGNIDGERFYIGTRVPYDGGKGLMNVTGNPKERYDRTVFAPKFKFWAHFIHPIAMAEGGLFHTLNTYDRAHFTFSFLQFAAHVPNGDFVLYLRELLKLSTAQDYFPDLAVVKGRIHKITDTGMQQLESDDSTSLLMDYLNPSTREIEDTEVIQAAKFIHWAKTDPAHRLAQISIGVKNFKDKMFSYSRRYRLDNVEDYLCLLVADIRHQGRAKSPEIIAAMQSSKPFDALLKIGQQRYPDRIRVLRREINDMLADGSLGRLRYSDAQKDFV